MGRLSRLLDGFYYSSLGESSTLSSGMETIDGNINDENVQNDSYFTIEVCFFIHFVCFADIGIDTEEKFGQPNFYFLPWTSAT